MQSRTEWPKFAKQLSDMNFTAVVSAPETEICDLSPVLLAHLFYGNANLAKTTRSNDVVAIKPNSLLSGKCHENFNDYPITNFCTAQLCHPKMRS